MNDPEAVYGLQVNALDLHGLVSSCAGYTDSLKCRRPKRVCLCTAYPHPPVEISGQIVVLQHPFEQR